MLICFIGLFSYAAVYPPKESRADTSIEDNATPVKSGDARTSSRLVITNNFIDPEHNCEFCTRMVYTPGPEGVAGLAYKDDKLDLGDSQRIVFFAKGQPGNEVSFVAAGNESKATSVNDTDIFPRVDFAVVTDNVTLKDDWQRFEIGLNGTELSDATYPFGIQLSANSTQKQVYYIKGVSLDTQPAQRPIPTVADTLNSTNSTAQLDVVIGANSTSSQAPAEIEFAANSTGGLAPYSFNWNFNDGSNGTLTGEKISHRFDKPGSYNVTVAAKDSSAPSQNASANVLVTISSSVNKRNIELAPLDVVIDANSTSSQAPAEIEFAANSTGGLAPYSFNWNFNDGSNGTLTGEKISHRFDKPGSYNVTVAAKDSSAPSQNASANVLVTISSILTVPLNSTNNNVDGNSTSSGIDGNSTSSGSQTLTTLYSGEMTNNSLTRNGIWNHTNFTIGEKNQLSEIVDKSLNHDIASTDNNTVRALNISTGDESNNHTPVAYDQIVSLPANKESEITLRGTDYDIDPITFELISNPSRGTIAEFDKTAGTLKYIPNYDSTGSDVFTFKIVDIHKAESEIGRVRVTVQKIQSDSFRVDDVSVATPSDRPIDIILKAVNGVSLDPLKFALVSDADHGKLGELTSVNDATVKVTYTPDSGYSGNDMFRFRVEDKNTGTNEEGKVSITVIASPPPYLESDDGGTSALSSSHSQHDNQADSKSRQGSNLAPVAKNQKTETHINERVRISLVGTDPDDNNISFLIAAQPIHGTLTKIDVLKGELTYIPNKDFVGADRFTFKAIDENGIESNIASVSIIITDVRRSEQSESTILSEMQANELVTGVVENHNPTANAGLDKIVIGGTSNVPLQGSSIDLDGDVFKYSWKQVAGPRVALIGADTSNPIFNTPAVGQDRILEFVLTVTDEKGASDADSVKITLVPLPVMDNQIVTDKSMSGTSLNKSTS